MCSAIWESAWPFFLVIKFGISKGLIVMNNDAFIFLKLALRARLSSGRKAYVRVVKC